MRVLVISASFPPMKAGEADHAYHIAAHVGRRVADVHVLTSRGAMVSGQLPFTMHAHMPRWSWKELPRLVRFLRSSAPDVVLLIYIGWIYDDHPMMTFAPTVIKAVLPNCRVVTQFEYPMGANNDKFSTLTRVMRRLVARWAGKPAADYVYGTLLRDSDRLVVLSDRHRRMLVEAAPSAEKKIALIPPPPLLTMAQPPDAETRKTVREKFGFAPDHRVFVYFGYIYPPKGVETLLKAFHIIAKEYPKARLLLVGGVVAHEYPQRPRFAEEMRQLPHDLGFAQQVVWAGDFDADSDEASRSIFASDICVFPHDLGVYLNNSSFAAVAAHGLPIVATKAEEVEGAFVNGENLLFCDPKSPESMAAAMRWVLSDDELCLRLGRGASRLATDWFSWEKATNRMVEVLGLGTGEGARSA